MQQLLKIMLKLWPKMCGLISGLAYFTILQSMANNKIHVSFSLLFVIFRVEIMSRIVNFLFRASKSYLSTLILRKLATLKKKWLETPKRVIWLFQFWLFWIQQAILPILGLELFKFWHMRPNLTEMKCGVDLRDSGLDWACFSCKRL